MELGILCAIMVVGPFFFFIVMVCSLKIFGYLNIDLFKPETSWSEGPEGSSRPSHRYSSEIVADSDLNEQYAFRDRWTTGLSLAVNLPIHIAMTEVPLLSTSVSNSHSTSQISSQVPHSRQRERRESSSSCATVNAVNSADISIPLYDEVRGTSEDRICETPPPDYNQARLLLRVQAEQHELPPLTYNECMQLKMDKIGFSGI